jgi:hypothetical protein
MVGCRIFLFALFAATVVTIPIPRIPGGNSEDDATKSSSDAAGTVNKEELDKTAYQQATNMYWQKIRENAAISAPDPAFDEEISEDDIMNHMDNDLEEEKINFRQDNHAFVLRLTVLMANFERNSRFDTNKDTQVDALEWLSRLIGDLHPANSSFQR